MAEKPVPQRVEFDIRKVYLKDVSFESPQSPGVFAGPTPAPKVDVQMRVSSQRMEGDNNFHECVLTVTATAILEQRTLFLAEIQQAGVFSISGLEEAELARVLQVNCPTILLPFAREEIAALTVKGGFPQLLLAPVSFEALYEQNRQRDQQAVAESGNGKEVSAAAGTKSDESVGAADDARGRDTSAS